LLIFLDSHIHYSTHSSFVFLMRIIFTFVALALGATPSLAQHGDHHGGHDKHAEAAAVTIPSSITAEHQELHRELAEALKVGGKTAKAAEVVAAKLHEHFGKEEELPMPLLGALGPLSRNEPLDDPAEVRDMSRRLRDVLPEMLADHVQIKTALHALVEAARAENRPDVEAFAKRLAVHATNEEEVLYPAAILVADVLEKRHGR
jgi:hypothetical protein